KRQRWPVVKLGSRRRGIRPDSRLPGRPHCRATARTNLQLAAVFTLPDADVGHRAVVGDVAAEADIAIAAVLIAVVLIGVVAAVARAHQARHPEAVVAAL